MPRKPGPPPSNVVSITGHRSKEELEAREAIPRPKPVDRSAPPAHLSPYAAECWRLHVAELKSLALFTVLDRASFELLCEHYAMARSALDELRFRKADGTPDKRRKGYELIVRDEKNQPRRHPAFIIWGQASAAYLRACIEFGLTPSARVHMRPAAGAGGGIQPGAPDDEGADGDASFFGD